MLADLILIANPTDGRFHSGRKRHVRPCVEAGRASCPAGTFALCCESPRVTEKDKDVILATSFWYETR
jgi:hypothetical protein